MPTDSDCKGGVERYGPKSRRGLEMIAVVACAGLVLAACSSSKSSSSAAKTPASSAPVTITFANWASDESNTAPGIKNAIALYE